MSKIKDSVKKITPFVKPYKFGFLTAILLIVIAAVFSAIAPRTEGLVITQLTNDSFDLIKGVNGASVNFKYITKILIVLLGVYLGNVLATYGASFLLTNAIQNSMRDLRSAVQDKIKRLPVSYFDKNSYGDVLSRITNDIDTISNALQQSLSQVVNSILAVTLALIMMFSINVKMALIATLIIPLSYMVSKVVVSKSQGYFKTQQYALGKLNGTVQEMYTGFNEIKLYGKEEDAIDEFIAINGKLQAAGFKAQFISSTMGPLVSLVCYLGIAAMGILGAIISIAGGITVGNLQAFIRYIWQINQPLSQVTQLSSAIQSAFAAVDRVFEFLNEEEQLEDKKTSVKLERPRGNVSFEHVKFGYSDDKILIVKHNLGHWDFPKGHVENNETEEETAIREVKEETNIDIEVDSRYRYVIAYSPKKGVIKDVVYFLGKATSFNCKNQEEEIELVEFVPISEALEKLTYDNAREVLQKLLNDLNK